MQKPINDGFTAEKFIFQCVHGYKIKQWNGGACVCSQFIPAEAFRGSVRLQELTKKALYFYD